MGLLEELKRRKVFKVGAASFQGFAKRMGMVDYWKQNGWPDLCQPAPNLGPDAFTCQ